MTLIAQVYWGAAFAGLWGFSFTVLRVSTIVLGALGIVAAYNLARESRLPTWAALLVAATLAFNPVYLALSCTFMTDVPFTAVSLAALWLIARGINRGSDPQVWLGWAAILAAVMIRQIGLGVALAAAVGYGMRHGLSRRWATHAAAPLVIVVIAVTLYTRAVEATIGLPAGFHVPNESLKAWSSALMSGRLGALKPTFYVAGLSLLYGGLMLLPILAVLRWDRRSASLYLLGGAVVGVALMLRGALMPLAPGILVPQGIGPLTLGGETGSTQAGSREFVTLAATVSAACLIVALTKMIAYVVRHRESTKQLWALVMLLVAAFAYELPFFMVYGPWFDRYLLLFLPLAGTALLLVLRPESPAPMSYGISAGVLILFAAFGVAATHDYLEWNRQRWSLAEVARRILPHDTGIDGGFEYNNYLFHLPRIRTDLRGTVNRDTATHAIVFKPREGDRVLIERQWEVWLPTSPRKILLVERAGDLH